MKILKYKPVIKLLIVVTGAEFIIMSAFHLFSGETTPFLLDMLDVFLLGLVTCAVAQRWIIKPLEQAREQDALFRAIAAGSDAGLMITDPANHNRIVYINSAFSRMTGYSMQKVKGKAPAFMTEGLEQQPMQTKILAAMESGTAIDGELKNRREDGSTFWSDVHLRPVQLGDDPVRYWLTLMHDRTEARGQDSQLKRLLNAIEQTREMIVLFDVEGRIEFSNPAFAQQVQRSQEELVGQSVWSFWSQENSNLAIVQQSLSDTGCWAGRNKWLGMDQKPYDAMTSISMVHDDETQVYIAVHRDMTESIELENKLAHAQKMESVGMLAGGIAHDFNNMLAAMMGNLYILRKSVADDEAALKRIESIENQGFRGADLIRQMLAFARKQTVEMKAFDLQKLSLETIELLKISMPSHIELCTDIDTNSMAIHGDLSLLQTSLFNLINNACDAIDCEKQDGVIKLSIHKMSLHDIEHDIKELLLNHELGSEQEYVHLMVSDNGSGMDEKTQAKVFEPYFTTKTVGQGTGLGLPMVMGTVEMHGGHMTMLSEIDQGTRFDIYLPLTMAVDQTLLPLITDIHPGHGELILLADRNVELCEALSGPLEHAGYQVIRAADSEEVLKQYMRHEDDMRLVIWDSLMPKVEGVCIGESIWNHSAGRVKTVVMGAAILDSEWAREACPELLEKPWEICKLNQVLMSISPLDSAVDRLH